MSFQPTDNSTHDTPLCKPFDRLALLLLTAILGLLIGQPLQEFFDSPSKPIAVFEGTACQGSADGSTLAIFNHSERGKAALTFVSPTTCKPLGKPLNINSDWGMLSPNGKYFGWFEKNQAFVWNVKRGKLVYSSQCQRDGFVNDLSNDGRYASQYWGGSGRVCWEITDLKTGKTLTSGETTHSDHGGFGFSGDGKYFALSSAKEGAATYTRRGRKRKKLKNVPGANYINSFSQAHELFSIQTKKGLQIFDFSSGKQIGKALNHRAMIALAFGIDRKKERVATYGLDMMVRIWDLHSGRLLRETPVR